MNKELIERLCSNLTLLHSYQNGNVFVRIYNDGTKIRETKGDEPFMPEFPESCDCKITNWCDGSSLNSLNACYWCHEKSHKNGKHADIDKLLQVLKDMPKGSELALGGGATLSHPDILKLLYNLKEMGLLVNITINQKHIHRDKLILETIFKDDLIKGIGISYSNPAYLDDIEYVLNKTDNAVFHVIAGVNEFKDINVLADKCDKLNKCCRVLVLGYKQFGLGISYYNLRTDTIEENKAEWLRAFPLYFHKSNLIFAFDNLAIEQLELRKHFDNQVWDTYYQGDDFSHTMYIDAVEQKFASTSCSKERYSFNDYTIKEFFQKFKQ